MSQKKMILTIQTLKKEIQLKDRIIGALLHLVAENKIKIPEHVLQIITILYKKVIQKEQETQTPEEIKPKIEKAIDTEIDNAIKENDNGNEKENNKENEN